jgi:hypothetical protein
MGVRTHERVVAVAAESAAGARNLDRSRVGLVASVACVNSPLPEGVLEPRLQHFDDFVVQTEMSKKVGTLPMTLVQANFTPVRPPTHEE